jgi:gluconokinase
MSSQMVSHSGVRADLSRHLAVVVMGVSGSGKTTVGAALAQRWRASFVDGDDLHPSANIEKMRRGSPLTDEDRWPWLDLVGAVLRAAAPRGTVVVSCSALRRAYRDRLRLTTHGAVRFVFLEASRAQIGERMASRTGHFMPAALIDTQFSTLEAPTADESDVVTVSADTPLEPLVATIVAAFENRTIPRNVP